MKKAFTLAEVLITLGIIGVVAALTMPALIAKNKEHIRNQQFKKAYATISNVLQLMQADSDSLPNCYYRNGVYYASYFTECPQFIDEFVSKLKVIKYCNGNALTGGCIPKYNNVPAGAGCDGFAQSSIFNSNPALVLADGTIIIIYKSGPQLISMLAVDINGKKPPNMWGHDIFVFTIDESPSLRLIPYGGTCQLLEDGGVTSQYMVESVIYN